MATAAVSTEVRSSCTTANVVVKPKVKPFSKPVSRQEVELVVKRALGSSCKLVNYYARIYSKEKVGFMGDHRHLVVTVKRENSVEIEDKEEVHIFFLKGIPYEIEEQASAITDSPAFYKETNFYKLIVPELIKSVREKSWVAQCYLINDSVMIFEDLKSMNFTIKEKILDITCIKSALTALANMHAASILAEKRMGKSFLELYPDLFQECLFVQTGKFDAWFRSGVQLTVAIAKHMGLDYSCIPNVCNLIFGALKASKKWRNVVCHGDPWSYNLMFDDSQPLPKCCLVDFQILRYAPSTVDVVQLFYLTMRRAYREKNEEDLLRYYHEVFCTILRENDEEISLPSFEETVQEYEEMRMVGVVTTAIYYPVMLVEGNLCAELTKDSDGYGKLIFGDRVDLVLNIMLKDANYRDRIMESVTELVQRSKKLLN